MAEDVNNTRRAWTDEERELVHKTNVKLHIKTSLPLCTLFFCNGEITPEKRNDNACLSGSTSSKYLHSSIERNPTNENSLVPDI